MTAKIAPTLVAFFRDAPTGIEYPGYEQARREVRALVAVARAVSPYGKYGLNPDMDRICRALDRLARVSGRSSRGSRRGGR